MTHFTDDPKDPIEEQPVPETTEGAINVTEPVTAPIIGPRPGDRD